MRARAAWPGLAVPVLGALAALGQAPASMPWIALGALACMAWLHLRARSAPRAALAGWAFGAGYFAAALHWIVEPFLVDPARHGWMAPFALAGLAAGLGLFWGAAGGLARALSPPGRLAGALAWAAMLALAELARSHALTGFPWALLGHAWVGWAPMSLAAWIGPVGLTLLTLLLPALVVGLLPSPPRLAAVLAGFAAVYAAGAWQAGAPLAAAEGPLVRLVQPNAPQHLKWHPDHARGFLERQLASTRAGAGPRPDLVVWPETAIPGFLDDAGPLLGIVAEAAGGAPVALGAQRRAGAHVYNSLAVIDAAGNVDQVYDKHRLVPFGEYVPAFGLLRATPFGSFVEEHGIGYAPGPGPRLLNLGPLGRVLPLVCYEAIFPHGVNAAPGRPDWILQVTNDAWFGDLAGPYQHLAQARLRAVEQGRSVVRVANTGISAVIDPRGRVVARLPLNRDGFVDARIPVARGDTPYSRTGDWPAALACLLLLAAALAARRARGLADGSG